MCLLYIPRTQRRLPDRKSMLMRCREFWDIFQECSSANKGELLVHILCWNDVPPDEGMRIVMNSPAVSYQSLPFATRFSYANFCADSKFANGCETFLRALALDTQRDKPQDFHDHRGWTVLHLLALAAAMYSDAHILGPTIRAVLDSSVDPCYQTNNGDTALQVILSNYPLKSRNTSI